MPVNVIADENIPLAGDAFGTLGRVRRLPGRALTPADVRAADVLLVRSVTPVGEKLLAGSAVRFVGSATIGTDHVDLGYLRARGITFAHAPGSNADSVGDYVTAAMLALAADRGVPLRGRAAGVVGCGNVGERLVGRLAALGLRVLKNDPPLAEAAEARGEAHDFVPLGRVLGEADLVTLHVPLTRGGSYATRHLIGAAELGAMRSGTWLLNTARGSVVQGDALKTALAKEYLGAAVLDVWEHEPTPDPDLLRRVHIATPHIAGYALDGKVRGTAMLYAALCDFLGAEATWNAEAALAPAPDETLTLQAPDAALPEVAWLRALVQQMYDLAADDAALRGLPEQPPEVQGAYFSKLRKHYPRRREFSRFSISAAEVPDGYRTAVATGLNVALS